MIHTSKDPSVFMTANGTTHMTEEATARACNLDMFFSSSIIERITYGAVAGNTVRRKGFLLMDGI